jgi:hypothetical protein
MKDCMRPGGMVMKRCIDGELKTMFGKNVYPVFGERETRPRPGTGTGTKICDLAVNYWTVPVTESMGDLMY